MGNDPVEMYRQSCRTIQELVESKIGRSLTHEESDKIWNAGSFMWLETIDRDFQCAATPAEAALLLASLPKREALPTEYTRRD